MNEEMKKTIDSKNAYVVFLDILGFSNYVLSHEMSEVHDVFNMCYNLLEYIKNDKIWHIDTQYEGKYNNLSESLYSYVMSDSIILAIESTVEYAFEFLIKYSKLIQQNLVSKGLLLRGGISVGEFYGDGKVNFGKALIYAHEKEQTARMPIIVLDDRVTYIPQKEDFLSVDIKEYNGMKYIDYCADLLNVVPAKKVLDFVKQGHILRKIAEKYDWLSENMQLYFDEYENKIVLEEIKNE